jgi:hypothetical protein
MKAGDGFLDIPNFTFANLATDDVYRLTDGQGCEQEPTPTPIPTPTPMSTPTPIMPNEFYEFTGQCVEGTDDAISVSPAAYNRGFGQNVEFCNSGRFVAINNHKHSLVRILERKGDTLQEFQIIEHPANSLTLGVNFSENSKFLIVNSWLGDAADGTGSVYVYENINDQFVKKGNTLHGVRAMTSNPPSSGSMGSHLGSGRAIRNDGNQIVVSSVYDPPTSSGHSNKGVLYTYNYDAETQLWEKEENDVVGTLHLGHALHMSPSGSMLFASQIYGSQGTHIFERISDTWTLKQFISPPAGLSPTRWGHFEVTPNLDTLVITDNVGNNNNGYVAVYKRSNDSYEFHSSLILPEINNAGFTASSITNNGKIILVKSTSLTTPTAVTYEYNEDTNAYEHKYTQQHTELGIDFGSSTQSSNFNSKVSPSGDLLLVSDSLFDDKGKVCVYKRKGLPNYSQKLEYRWKEFQHENKTYEVLQMRGMIPPTNPDTFKGQRNTQETWSTVYAFTADPEFYGLGHGMWPDAAVNPDYELRYGMEDEFDGLKFTFGDVETEEHQMVKYTQILVHLSDSDVEFLPNVSVSQPAYLYIFGGDNDDPENSALLTNSSWPVVARLVSEVTPTPTPTPTPSPITECCEGFSQSVELEKAGDVWFADKAPVTILANQDAKFCWNEFTTSGQPQTFNVKLQSSTHNLEGTIGVSVDVLDNSNNLFRINLSNGDCFEGRLESTTSDNIFTLLGGGTGIDFNQLTIHFEQLEEEVREPVQFSGTIEYVELEGGFYGIQIPSTNGGVNYIPVNNQDELSQNVGKILTATVAYTETDRVSFYGYGELAFLVEYTINDVIVTPSPTPTPTPTPTPVAVIQPQLEFRWKEIDGLEVLQVKGLLKPTNESFENRNTHTNWSTLYGFTASADIYDLNNSVWPDAAVDPIHEVNYGTDISYDGLTFELGNTETIDINGNQVKYRQLALLN